MHERCYMKRAWRLVIAVIVLCWPLWGHFLDKLRGSEPQGTVITDTYLSNSDGTRYDLGELTDGTVVRQSFVAEFSQLYSVTLWGANWGRDDNAGTFYVQLKSDSEEILQQWQVDVASMENDTQFTLYVQNMVPMEVGQRYWIEIMNEGSLENRSATFFAVEEDWYSQGGLTVNGEERQGDLWVKLQCAVQNRSYVMQKVILRFLVGAIILWVVYCRMSTSKGKKREHETYL